MQTRHIRRTAAPRGADAARHGSGRRGLRVATALAAVMTVAGCASVEPAGSSPTPAVTDDVSDDVSDDAVAGEAPLLQIERSGGFVLMGTDFASVPELTVYPDGEAITHGPQIAIYPPPTLPNLLRHDLTEADVDALLAAARDAGLLEDRAPDYGQPPVADAPTTSVTLTVDGRTVTHAAEALGMAGDVAPEPAADGGGDEPLPDRPLPGDDALPGLTEAERTARAELAAFVARAHELVGAAGEGEPYGIDAFAVMARPAPDGTPTEEGEVPAQGEGDAAGTLPAPDSGLEPQVLPWPLDVPLAEAHDCVVVDGAAAQTLLETLTGTGSTTRYEQEGVGYDVWFRPLLPHEEGCGDV